MKMNYEYEREEVWFSVQAFEKRASKPGNKDDITIRYYSVLFSIIRY